ncbi:MAG: threonylcarbamoyl-AMP synthase [Deltaproteobacteria bacterium]|nr:MAG: threonylcarbamoyl-AMP synthase [Deltaproteobacteria bacterium]
MPVCDISQSEYFYSMLRPAVEKLRQDGVIAFPTETYYGLAADSTSNTALNKLYRIKNRPSDKPLLVLISKEQQLCGLIAEFPVLYRELIDRYWPGPLTLIFKAAPQVSPVLTAGTGTIGIRLSSSPIARSLVALFGKPITATSANPSGMRPGRSREDIENMFGNQLDHIVDGGQACAALGSTIVSLKSGKLQLVRQGQILLPGKYFGRDSGSGAGCFAE